jgi:hypothetical protein
MESWQNTPIAVRRGAYPMGNNDREAFTFAVESVNKDGTPSSVTLVDPGATLTLHRLIQDANGNFIKEEPPLDTGVGELAELVSYAGKVATIRVGPGFVTGNSYQLEVSLHRSDNAIRTMAIRIDCLI